MQIQRLDGALDGFGQIKRLIRRLGRSQMRRSELRADIARVHAAGMQKRTRDAINIADASLGENHRVFRMSRGIRRIKAQQPFPTFPDADDFVALIGRIVDDRFKTHIQPGRIAARR